MSVAGILSSAALSLGAQFFQSRARQMKQEFQQLGSDLQSGNLTAAQADFATLQQLRPQTSSASSSSTNPIAQDFTQLAADLKAGNTTAAQQDYAKIQKDMQPQPPTLRHHHHHSGNGSDAVSQLFTQIGQALQSGNLSAAQQAYASMQQQFQQYAQVNALLTGSSASGISVSA